MLEHGGDITKIRDLSVKREGVIYKNPARELRRDLDSLPFPPRRLLYEYDDRLRLRPLKSFTTNRGSNHLQRTIPPHSKQPCPSGHDDRGNGGAARLVGMPHREPRHRDSQ